MHKTMKHLGRRLGVNGPGLTVAVIALVIALAGGAYAASGALTSKQQKEVTKIAKKYAGKPGAQGPAGPAGPAGVKGDTGSQGPEGKEGKEGKAGTNGVSVTSTESLGPIDGKCPEGGSRFESASGKTYACNGAEGPPGPKGDEGSPWTVNGTLPPGKVETGSWAFAATPEDTAGVSVPLSFFIPLAAPLEGHVHFQFEPTFGNSCEQNAEFPLPKAGELCVYVNNGEEPEPSHITFEGIFSSSFPEIGASPQGAVLKFSAPDINLKAGGTFAVRAPVGP